MATTAAATLNPADRQMLDLDAGTTLPRGVSIAIAILLIAVTVAVHAMPSDRDTSGTTTVSRIEPQTITMPALRPTLPLYQPPASPYSPVGPSAALVDATTGLVSADAIGQ